MAIGASCLTMLYQERFFFSCSWFFTKMCTRFYEEGQGKGVSLSKFIRFYAA